MATAWEKKLKERVGVVMTFASAHNGQTFHYKAIINIIILKVAAISGPHHQFMALH